MVLAISPTRLVGGKLVPAAGTWEVDPGHTMVAFEGTHLMVSRIRGTFSRFSGHLDVADNPEDSHAELAIEAASVESGFKDRDDHLRSPDWFDVGRYPMIRFESGSIQLVAGNHWKAGGNLTIRELTRQIDVDIEFEGGTVDPWGNHKIGAVITAAVNRKDFGLTWNMPLAAGGLLVGNEIRLTVAVEAIYRGSKMVSVRQSGLDTTGVAMPSLKEMQPAPVPHQTGPLYGTTSLTAPTCYSGPCTTGSTRLGDPC